ncbi:hypothetical protein GCM10023148_53820 [Actinokineospora soli]
MLRKQFRKVAVIALLASGALAYPAQAAPPTCTNGYVALTFDDGPFAATTARLLATLRDENVRATFFTVGRNIEANPELQRLTKQAGMWIGNHSWSHPFLTELSPGEVYAELAKTQFESFEVNKKWPTLFRPPYGATNADIASTARQLGMTEVLWSVDSRDWSGISTAEIRANAAAVQPGGVVLLHDGIPNTIDAVPQIVSDLRERGLCAGKIVVRDGQPVVVAP